VKKKIIRRVEPESRIDAIADAVKGVLGSEAVHLASESDLGEPRMFVPSGVPELDYVLDRDGRGWPVGRIVEIYGGEATAKTGIGYALIAQVQKMGGDATLHPSEGNVDSWLLDRYGVDGSRLIIGDDETVQGTFKSFYAAMKAAGRTGLLVSMVDSIAGLVTKEELEDEEFDRDRAAQIRAMLISKAMRKLGATVPRTNSILFCVNQVRDATDSMMATKPKPPGGRALKFYASIRLRLEQLGKVKRTCKGKQYIAGFKLRVTAEKNRLANPYQQAEIVIDFERGLFPADTYTQDVKRRRK
jgi:recombination protein RecA